MRNLGYTHGYAARSTGLGMRHADADYVAGFQAGYADQARDTAARAAAVAVVTGLVRWQDALNVSVATVRPSGRTERTYRVRLSGTKEYTAEWMPTVMDPYGWRVIGRSYSRDHAKSQVVAHMADYQIVGA